MIIDILFLLLLGLAVFKGMRNGLISSLFSFISFFIALAAAIKLSATCTNYMADHFHSQSKWLPFLSFILVFACFMIVIHYIGKAFEKTAEIMMMGWLNKLGGICFYMLMYGLSYSILLFYAKQMHLISDETEKASRFYHYLEPLGPSSIEMLGNIIPFFKGLFLQLENYFQDLSHQAQ